MSQVILLQFVVTCKLQVTRLKVERFSEGNDVVMSNRVLSQGEFKGEAAFSRNALPLSLLIVIWLVTVLAMGADGFFEARLGQPPLALLTFAVTPVLVFLVAYWVSATVRESVAHADARLVTAIQAWRIGGYSFLLLYSYGFLPGLFAWPAGVGDMLIGLTAPLVAYSAKKKEFVAGRMFRIWNVLGILDLVLAVGFGALGAVLAGSGSDHIPTTPMSALPLVLVPTFFVPSFVILHLVALFKSRRLGRG